MTTTERRKFERLEKEGVLHYQKLESLQGEGTWYQATMLDFSGGGVRFLGRESFDKSTQLVMDLEFSGWAEQGESWVKTESQDDVGLLRVIGSVMWCVESGNDMAEYEVGFRFTGRIKDSRS